MTQWGIHFGCQKSSPSARGTDFRDKKFLLPRGAPSSRDKKLVRERAVTNFLPEKSSAWWGLPIFPALTRRRAVGVTFSGRKNASARLRTSFPSPETRPHGGGRLFWTGKSAPHARGELSWDGKCCRARFPKFLGRLFRCPALGANFSGLRKPVPRARGALGGD